MENLGLLDYLQYDGFSYRLVPILTPATDVLDIGRIDPAYTAPLLLGESDRAFRYGNLADPRVYADYFIQYNLGATHARNAFARVASKSTYAAATPSGRCSCSTEASKCFPHRGSASPSRIPHPLPRSLPLRRRDPGGQ